MKAIIKIDVPEFQIGQEVSVYFKDTMCVKGICETDDGCDNDCEHCNWTECPKEPNEDAISIVNATIREQALKVGSNWTESHNNFEQKLCEDWYKEKPVMTVKALDTEPIMEYPQVDGVTPTVCKDKRYVCGNINDRNSCYNKRK